MDATDTRIEGGGKPPLSARQKSVLIRLAREAFMYLVDRGELGDAAEFDVWRRAQVMQSVERAGLRECHNEDFLPLKRRFLQAMGREDEAAAAEARSENETRTWAVARLHQACIEVADVMPYAWDYAMGILKKHGMDDQNAEPRWIWRCLYTVKRRAGQLRAKQGRAA